MKTLLRFIAFVLMVGSAYAQSDLPACQGGAERNSYYVSTAKWHNCFGTWKDPGQNATYVGEWRNGKQNGQGKMTSVIWQYVGEWRNGKENGQGTFTHVATKYIGEFKDGSYSGKGILYDKFSGKVLKEGLWANGQLQQSAESNLDAVRLRAEAEEAKRKQSEAESQQRLQAQQAIQRQRELEEQLKLTKLDTRPINATTVTLNVFANRRALVIGNDSYKSVAKLENAREDARTIAANLSSVGYQVTLKLDLTEKEMKASLRTFASQVEGGDEVMFFFAGHGVQLGATNYLLPTDIGGESEAQVRDESIQLQRILDDMSDRKAKFTLAMIDACRDNPFKSSGRAIGGRGLAPTTAATGQMVIFSAGTGQQALDKLNNADKNKNGLFTRVFVQEMQKPNQSIDRVVKNVRNQVAELAKSVGHEQVPAIYDQVLGDFYFKK